MAIYLPLHSALVAVGGCISYVSNSLLRCFNDMHYLYYGYTEAEDEMKDYTINGTKWLISQLHPGIPVHFRAPLGTGGPNVVVDALKAKGKTLFIGGVLEGQSFTKHVHDSGVNSITSMGFIDYSQEYVKAFDCFILGKNVHARHRVPILATLQSARKYIISL